MEYKVITSASMNMLESEVNSYLMSGWQLQGGIAVREMGFYQAIFRIIK